MIRQGLIDSGPRTDTRDGGAMTDLHVVFIHLDLGIGGAESLVLNLAKATLHPNLGVGGPRADKLDDNSADVKKPFGRTSIYTTHCSPNHCYDEVKPPDGPLSSYVHVRGSWIPRKFYFGGTALCSALRILYLTFKAMKENPQANVFVIDVLPTGVPYLAKYCNVSAGVLFYCHFPDKLLTRDTVNGETDIDEGDNSAGLLLQCLLKLKRIYRWVLDTIEEWTMSFSDMIVVNSKFTRDEVEKVFPSLFLSDTNSDRKGERVRVLYPSIESSLAKQRRSKNNNLDGVDQNKNKPTKESKEPRPIVSLNRFERKKNIALLLHVYDLLLEQASNGDVAENLPPLIIAGGYDPINVENVEHLSELRILADEILGRYMLPRSTVYSSSKSRAGADGILEQVENIKNSILHTETKLQNASITFHLSISNTKRAQLFSCASVWCYTPHREHFGIVPLEAMDAGVPVVAIRSGGPIETIVDKKTGYLIDYSPLSVDKSNNNIAQKENPTVKGFADAIHKIISDPSGSQAMGQRGREHVDQTFGMDAFREQWWKLIMEAKKRGFERHQKACTSYPSVSLSVIRLIGEMFWVILFGVFLNWALRNFTIWAR